MQEFSFSRKISNWYSGLLCLTVRGSSFIVCHCTNGNWFEVTVDAQNSLPNNRENIEVTISGSCCAVVTRNRDRCYNREKNTPTAVEYNYYLRRSVCSWFSQGIFWSTAAPVLEAAVLPASGGGWLGLLPASGGGCLGLLPAVSGLQPEALLPRSHKGQDGQHWHLCSQFNLQRCQGCNCCWQLNS